MHDSSFVRDNATHADDPAESASTDIVLRPTAVEGGTAVLLNLLGTPSPVGELFLIAVVLYVVSALYFGNAFEAEELDRSLDEANEEGPS